MCTSTSSNIHKTLLIAEHLKHVNKAAVCCVLCVHNGCIVAAAGDHMIDVTVRGKCVDMCGPCVCQVFDNDQIIISNIPSLAALGKPVSFGS